MSTLKDAIRTSLVTKRRAKKRDSPSEGGLFNVTIEFEVAVMKKMVYLVTADNSRDAVTEAVESLENTDNLHLVHRSDFTNPKKYTIRDAKVGAIQKASGTSLSTAQRKVLESMFNDGYKLFSPGSWTQSRELRKTEGSRTHIGRVTAQTVDALYRKGLIIPESKLVGKEETKIQKALGILPSEKVLVVNRAKVAKLRLRLKEGK